MSRKVWRWAGVGVVAMAGSGLWNADRADAVPTVIDVVGHLPASEFNTFIKPQSYKDWGNEPFIAVNPVTPSQIVISSFAQFRTPGASLWFSTNSGADWNIRFPITPNPAPGVQVPFDQTFVYDAQGRLHGAFLGGDDNIYHGSTTDPNRDGRSGRPASVWTWTPGRVNLAPNSVKSSDQPWIAAGGGKVHIAYDNFNPPPNAFTRVEERVVRSNNNGATFTVDNPISRGGKIPTVTNPGTRIAMDENANVYSIFGIGDNLLPGDIRHVNYRLNRFSGGPGWDFTTANPNPGGLIVDDGNSAQLTNSFGGVNQLRGNITAIAADRTGAHVYTVYGKRDAANVDRLFLAEFHPDPLKPANLVRRANPVAFSVAGERAALPSVAVINKGTVFVLYDTFSNGQFHVHLARSGNLGLNFSDEVLYNFTAPPLGAPAFPGNRELGDYQFLTALGNTVYGTFAARGNVNAPGTGIVTTDKIDPFFFSASVPQPPGLWLLALGALGIALRSRRRQAAVPEPTPVLRFGPGFSGLSGIARRRHRRNQSAHHSQHPTNVGTPSASSAASPRRRGVSRRGGPDGLIPASCRPGGRRSACPRL